ncbi:Evolutionarily conserved signaling intermediate in Toll pathway, mitochondrial [Amphibalanus amphitrite]|uniref:Evolutionarily conserved signaling intermediate in Toll pathway, mitochondrial n=1 Tax=Amphibalanus amphitrite TaxID=1232801 RepID=A0A6A4W2Z8_AMPAM|nr:Evolutionarily conserved signaling intermediate in Toll pathway, mitochondrial [Amphibalanus amphitrite]KAF0298111.1 Evolutionarily conserved signaling intermediate in Toll pathway, mitochondrial [Amphibalanus amphitrite]KAF0298112.1 Evolutionarily conserved signaling intermediate in Toll pathway, mitochondrial [Amphibalanus amphitrite]
MLPRCLALMHLRGLQLSWCRLRAARLPQQRVTQTAGIHVAVPQAKEKRDGHVNTKLVPHAIFGGAKEKNKNTYLAAMDMFHEMTVHKRGHVEFIYAALREMENYGVHKDLEAYKKVLGVFPVGQMVSTNVFQVEFMHYPRQQNCAIDVLQQMEDNGVIPDLELRDQLITIFGKFSFPVRKLARMLYWMPKFRNQSPWLLPRPLPSELQQLAQLAVKQITSVDARSEVTTFTESDLPEDAVDSTWIVSGQSGQQRRLLEEHPADKPLFVEGAYTVWLQDQAISYFVLRAEPQPQRQHEGLDSDDITYLENWTWRRARQAASSDSGGTAWNVRPPSVHIQEDGTIMAVCATGTSSRDSLLSWIRLLERQCPRLAELPVVFTLRSPETGVTTTDENPERGVTTSGGSARAEHRSDGAESGGAEREGGREGEDGGESKR